MTTSANIQILEGTAAPRYDEQGTELVREGVTITERGTQEGLPIVDLKLRGPDGKFYLLVMSGRIVNAVAMTLRAINFRNHGTETP